jgi:hypothetical protein
MSPPDCGRTFCDGPAPTATAQHAARITARDMRGQEAVSPSFLVDIRVVASGPV